MSDSSLESELSVRMEKGFDVGVDGDMEMGGGVEIGRLGFVKSSRLGTSSSRMSSSRISLSKGVVSCSSGLVILLNAERGRNSSSWKMTLRDMINFCRSGFQSL